MGLSGSASSSCAAHATVPTPGRAAGRRLTLMLCLLGCYRYLAGLNGAAAQLMHNISIDEHCDHYGRLYGRIDDDLEVHRIAGGVTYQAMRYAAEHHGTAAMRGMTVGFFGGVAYLLNAAAWDTLEHHAPLHLAYMKMLLALERTFGNAIPDSVFVISTSDTPRHPPIWLNETNVGYGKEIHWTDGFAGPLPIFAYCKSDHHPDVLLIPMFHFHTKMYDQSILGIVGELDSVYPWDKRKPVLFGRFSHYKRNRFTSDPHTMRLGAGGRPICYNENKTCNVRKHFISWAQGLKNNPDLGADTPQVDVEFSRTIPMREHASYKYLLQLDGQGLSSRLEQLLPLGSLVFREQSGYFAYYYHMMHPGIHYMPFWQRVPEELLDQLKWASDHDEQARKIAANGREFAKKYLNAEARACYWYRLLLTYGETILFDPTLSEWPEAKPISQVVEVDLLQTDAGKELAEAPWAP